MAVAICSLLPNTSGTDKGVPIFLETDYPPWKTSNMFEANPSEDVLVNMEISRYQSSN